MITRKTLKVQFIFIVILLNISLLNSCTSHFSSPESNTQKQQNNLTLARLDKANWDDYNYKELDLLIQQYGKNSPNYNPTRPPYAVFDFDNTSLFLDIEEATLIYQLDNLVFKVDPEKLNKIIRQDIPSQDFNPEFNNQLGQAVNIDKVATDIQHSYQWLYENYAGFKGKQSLAQVKQNPHYQNFRTKMRYLYEAIGASFDQKLAYAWITYLFAGFNENEVKTLARQSYFWQLQNPVEDKTWQSPEQLAGLAGVVSVKWHNGLRAYAEMQNLYQTLQRNGIDVYICSASFIDVVKEIGSNLQIGFNVPESHVFAFELNRDQQNKIMPQLKSNYTQPFGPGKTQVINTFLVSKYGYGPIFVAGDSRGDVNMMQDFKDTKKVLIINRLSKSDQDIMQLSKRAIQQYGSKQSKYLLQGRDANTGLFLPTINSILLGSKTSLAIQP